MRASGTSPNDTLLVLMTLVVAGGIVVMLLGGPREVIFALEHMTRTAISAIGNFLRAL